LKVHPAFGAPARAALSNTVAAILDRPFDRPKDWGAAFIAFPTAAPNNSDEPRFMLSGGVTTDQWGWA
jgi:hypothetical protein